MINADSNNRPLTKKVWWLAWGIAVAWLILAFVGLGETNVPQTWYQFDQKGERFIVDLGKPTNIEKLFLYTGIGEGAKYQVDASNDGKTWVSAIEAKRLGPHIWTWSVNKLSSPVTGRYWRWTVLVPGEMMFEIAFAATGEMNSTPIVGIIGADDAGNLPATPQALTKLSVIYDEPGTFRYYNDFRQGMFFDEIYHSRTAWEHIHALEPFEWTHPPLGKLIIAVGELTIGMNPLGWRTFGVLFGMLMLPLIFGFANRLFRNPWFGIMTELLFAFDFMHFTQSRIGTVDVFLVFFIIAMYYAFYPWWMAGGTYGSLTKKELSKLSDVKLDLGLRWLAISGFFLGCAAATKWNGLYAGAGLAFAFFPPLWRMNKDWKTLKAQPLQKTLTILGVAFACFIVVPVVIYLATYIPYFAKPRTRGFIEEILSYQANMYAYHAGVTQEHPFSSTWWQWPLLVKPLWYYSGNQDGLPPGVASSIVGFGNPMLWWAGIPAFFYLAYSVFKRKERPAIFVFIGLVASYLPWAIAPRKLTFIYHFFPIVPFFTLAVVYAFYSWYQIRISKGVSTKPVIVTAAAYVAVNAFVFAMFYPVLSGAWVSREYIQNFLHWIPGWYF